MKLWMSTRVRLKLKDKHNVTEKEVEQCFINRDGPFLKDTRAQHKTDPVTQWFIAETNRGRKLKVCFVFRPESKTFELKTAYDPNSNEVRIYDNSK